ncbi:MAG: ABC transporter substrate-binding protein [Myxococcales bacterium]|nr:ABC transporter substrate-binding protein [Myxococcales bacterium]
MGPRRHGARRRGARAASARAARRAHALLGLVAATLGASCSLLYEFDACTSEEHCDPGLVCRDGSCQPLQPEDVLRAPCEGLIGIDLSETTDPNTILIGTVFPETGALDAGIEMNQAVALAVDEINESGGVNGRRLGVVTCDSQTDPDVGVEGIRYLVETLQMQAIIGAAISSATISGFTDIARPRGVFMISPASTSPLITSLPDDGLLWRTVPSDAIQGRAVARYIVEHGYTRVAVINRDDAYGRGLRDVTFATLCELGFPCTSADAYLTRVYPEQDFAATQQEIATTLAGFAPEAVVLVSFVDDGLAQLKEIAATGATSEFIVTDGMNSEKVAAGITNAEIKCKLVGTKPAAPEGDATNRFRMAYLSKYTGHSSPGVFTENSYDAAYLVAYAFAAAGAAGEPTGADIAAALRRFSSGDAVEAGPSDWGATLQRLTDASYTFDFVGASGALDFDENGDSSANIEMWGIDAVNNTIASRGVILDEDDVYYPPTLPDCTVP